MDENVCTCTTAYLCFMLIQINLILTLRFAYLQLAPKLPMNCSAEIDFIYTEKIWIKSLKACQKNASTCVTATNFLSAGLDSLKTARCCRLWQEIDQHSSALCHVLLCKGSNAGGRNTPVLIK